MSKTIAVTVPTQGKVIIVAPKKKMDNGQADMFVQYRAAWLDLMLGHIALWSGDLRMSAVRKMAAVKGLSAPLDPNWYGALTKQMKAAGWQCMGYEISPIKSRNGGVERIWRRVA